MELFPFSLFDVSSAPFFKRENRRYGAIPFSTVTLIGAMKVLNSTIANEMAYMLVDL